jgi:hypothetical protein
MHPLIAESRGDFALFFIGKRPKSFAEWNARGDVLYWLSSEGF